MTWGSLNYFGTSKTIFSFENTFRSDKIARKYQKLVKLDTPDQPDPPSLTDSPSAPVP